LADDELRKGSGANNNQECHFYWFLALRTANRMTKVACYRKA